MPDIELSKPTEEQVITALMSAVADHPGRPFNRFPLTFTGGSKIDHRSFKLEFEDEERNRLDFIVYVVKGKSIYDPVG